MENLKWTTEQREVNKLIPLEINPRKISESKRMKMIESLQKFNLVDIPVCDIDGTVISGHQRLRALQAIGRGEEMIDVRIPNRKLSVKEVKEYNLLANSHFGEFDFELISEGFGDIDFSSIGVDIDFDKIGAPAAVPVEAPDPFIDPGISAKNQYGVIVICENEGVQESVFRDLQGMGFNCKIVVT